MSKLDELLGDDWHNEKMRLELKQQIKDLMVETYNKALKLHFIDKEAASLDEGFEKAVDEL